MTDIETPWTHMKSPLGEGLTTLRVRHEESNPWYWIKSNGGAYGAAIQLPVKEEEIASTVQGTAKINIVRINDSNGDHYLGVVINSSELATVFHRLCLDLMSACRYSENPSEIIAILKRRVLAWQRLFEKGNRRLSVEKCLGLIAELMFLKDYWIQNKPSRCVSGWIGPTGASQDFRDETLGVSVEIKSHSFDSNIVKISSKEQLDSEDLLFIVAYPGCLSSGEAGGKSLNEYVEEVRRILSPNEYSVFDERLLTVGYVYDPYYDEMEFQIGEPKAYKIEGDFPRLTEYSLPVAISRIRYEVDLALAADWICLISDID
ncbi:PD-(D/E)XK motif protein [Aliamphritea ceti]|uniref:PD-(D/E)XK motif protein n=1 Tax=Aliamphritea ceti TaxID=1524258 RepID=UPI0021C31540|nr:PD-(D/E)XK motif protein [Aliamphritea ceti]